MILIFKSKLFFKKSTDAKLPITHSVNYFKIHLMILLISLAALAPVLANLVLYRMSKSSSDPLSVPQLLEDYRSTSKLTGLTTGVDIE